MFTHIIAVTNLEPNGDRALPVARALGSLADVDVEVLKVAPRSSSASVDTYELRRRAAEQGWPVANARVVEADDVAAAIAGEVNRRPDTLLVMATSARIPLLGHLLGSVSEAVLGLVDPGTVLLVGPHVPAEVHSTTTLRRLCAPAHRCGRRRHRRGVVDAHVPDPADANRGGRLGGRVRQRRRRRGPLAPAADRRHVGGRGRRSPLAPYPRRRDPRDPPRRGR